MSDNKNSKSSDRKSTRTVDKRDKNFSDKKDNSSFSRKKKEFSDKKGKKQFDKPVRRSAEEKEEKNFDKRTKKPFVRKDKKFSEKDSKYTEKRATKPYDKRDKKFSDNKESGTFEKRNEKFSEKKTHKPFDKRFEKHTEDENEHSGKKEIAFGKRSSYKKGKTSSGFKKGKYTNDDEAAEIKDRLIKKGTAKRSSTKKTTKEFNPLDPVRLNKYIASAGVCSRREADELIREGKVKINGKVVTEMGIKVAPTDRIEVRGKVLNPEKKVYILLNKPKDTVSTVSDPHAERTVLDLIDHPGHERIYPVGRLDRNTTGVLLLTNDGDLTKKLTHPSYNKKKIYHVLLDKVITKAELQQILEGIELDDGPIAADTISYANENDKREVGIELHSGKNRIVRRIFEHLGYHVDKLDRVYFAGLTKKNVPRGKWRYLSEKEISMLKMGAYE